MPVQLYLEGLKLDADGLRSRRGHGRRSVGRSVDDGMTPGEDKAEAAEKFFARAFEKQFRYRWGKPRVYFSTETLRPPVTLKRGRVLSISGTIEVMRGSAMKVFISHSYEDRAVALSLARALEERTLEPWTSARLRPGKDWKTAITQAVSESQGFLFLVGPQSQEDRWLQVEWQAILESDWDRSPQRPMIPLLLGDVTIPAFLADRVALRTEGSMDLPVDRIVQLLLNPEETRLPVNYDQARLEQKQRLDVLKQFALSLKLASQHPEGHSWSQ